MKTIQELKDVCIEEIAFSIEEMDFLKSDKTLQSAKRKQYRQNEQRKINIRNIILELVKELPNELAIENININTGDVIEGKLTYLHNGQFEKSPKGITDLKKGQYKFEIKSMLSRNSFKYNPLEKNTRYQIIVSFKEIYNLTQTQFDNLASAYGQVRTDGNYIIINNNDSKDYIRKVGAKA